jgi:thymidylate synthase
MLPWLETHLRILVVWLNFWFLLKICQDLAQQTVSFGEAPVLTSLFWFRKHIYSNHEAQVKTQLSRTPLPYPTMRIKRRPASIFDYEFDDFELVGYEHHPAIKGAVAV